jgi:DNA-binding response OmpR family regulator
MPGFGGQRTAHEVLALHPGAQVLYISGYTERSAVLQELTTDDVDLLAKPFSVSELVAKVDAALARATTR